MIGSHIDTVRDAGRYDGNLGALAALSVVEELTKRGERLDVAVEIVAFGDEEGVRFPTTLTGSRAFAGLFARSSLDQKDADGDFDARGADRFGCEPEAVATLRGRTSRPSSNCISSRARCSRRRTCRSAWSPRSTARRACCDGRGVAGHAGGVPMALRQRRARGRPPR